ncbi:hypothetical protein [Micromonospora sp. HUAS LYJ1]|uniref:hypothetical protein n=1 Tax=Micromonospora sp. HUAS LYJ1 TaxID=3061626 RepID=UPI0034A0112C
MYFIVNLSNRSSNGGFLEHGLGLLEFAAEPEHQPPCPYIEPFQVRVGHRRVHHATAGRRPGVGQRRLVPALAGELLGVVVTYPLEFRSGAVDGAGDGGEGVVVGGCRVVRALHLADQLVQFSEVRPGGGVRGRRPRLG